MSTITSTEHYEHHKQHKTARCQNRRKKLGHVKKTSVSSSDWEPRELITIGEQGSQESSHKTQYKKRKKVIREEGRTYIGVDDLRKANTIESLNLLKVKIHYCF